MWEFSNIKRSLTGVLEAEGKSDKAVILEVLLELRADSLGRLDILVRHGSSADLDSVRVDVSAGGASILVFDRPGGTRHQFRGGRSRGGVVGVAGAFRRGKLGRKDPKVRRTRVEVEVQRLTANGHRAEIFLVILGRVGRGGYGSVVGRGRSSDLGRDRGSELAVGIRQGNGAGLDKRLLDVLVDGEPWGGTLDSDWGGGDHAHEGQGRIHLVKEHHDGLFVKECVLCK